MRALIFGTGAVGSIYGYIFSKAGVEVVVVCRSNFNVVQQDGITIRSALWGNVHYKPTPVKMVSEARQYGPFDYVFVCSKAFSGTAEKIKEAISPETAIILAQNGIEIEEPYRELYPDNAILSGVVWLPTTQTSPGIIDMGPIDRLGIGTYPATAPQEHKAKVKALSEIWLKGGGNMELYDDVQEARWTKISMNCAFNPMCALTRCDGANLLLSSDEADDMIVKVFRSISAVAAAAGYHHMTEEFIQKSLTFQRARKQTGGKAASMLVDVWESRPIEVEAIVGNTVRIARRHGVEVPYLEMLYVLAQGLNFSIMKPPGRWKELNTSA